MVFRAHKGRWINLVAGLLVGAAAQPLGATAAPPAVYTLPLLAAAQQPEAPRPTTASLALTSAGEMQRRGDFETATQILRDVQARQNELSPAEKQELARLLQSSTVSLKSRG